MCPVCAVTDWRSGRAAQADQASWAVERQMSPARQAQRLPLLQSEGALYMPIVAYGARSLHPSVCRSDHEEHQPSKAQTLGKRLACAEDTLPRSEGP